MNSKLFAIAGLLTSLVLQCFADDVVTPAEKTDALFHEDFSRYELGPIAGYNKDAELKEENGKRFVRAGKDDNVAGNTIGYFANGFGREWPEYSFRFKIRTVEKFEEVQLLFKCWGKRPVHKFGRYVIAIKPDKLTFNCEGLQKPAPPKKEEKKDDKKDAKKEEKKEEKKPAPEAPKLPDQKPIPPEVLLSSVGVKNFEPGKWYEFELQVMDERAKLFVKQDEKWMLLCNIETEDGTGGPNFNSKLQQLDIEKMVVTELPDKLKTRKK